MSKTVFFNNLGDQFAGRNLGAFLDSSSTLEMAVDSDTQVTYTDGRDFTMVLKGTDFAGDETGLTDGTIKSATFFNPEGQKLASVTSFSADAVDFDETLAEGFTANVFISQVFKGKDTFTASDLGDSFFAGNGNDVIKGGDGRDFLGGGKGDDTLTGGANDDTFHFKRGHGKDVITDFDAKGKFGAEQDFFQINNKMENAMEVEKSGQNDTLLDFGKGDTILLKGVKPGDIDSLDFAL